jgi:hypothetical protein
LFSFLQKVNNALSKANDIIGDTKCSDEIPLWETDDSIPISEEAEPKPKHKYRKPVPVPRLFDKEGNEIPLDLPPVGR